MANFTENGNHTTVQLLYNCPTGRYGVHLKIFISALNIPLCITALLGNILIIIALNKTSSLRPPSKLLFGCLASTDLCVGLIAQPLLVIYLMSKEHSKLCVSAVILFVTIGAIFCGVSILTLTLISLERLLFLLLGLRYRHVVTLRRLRAVIVTFWLLCIFNTIVLLFSPLLSASIALIVLILCIVTSTSCYLKIYLTLRHHQPQVQPQVQPEVQRQVQRQVQDHFHQEQQNRGEIPLNIARYRKTVSSALWLQMALLTCYVPFGTVAILEYIVGLSTPSTNFIGALALTLLCLNSSLNPFLYCWKMRDVRQAVKDTIRQFWCLSN